MSKFKPGETSSEVLDKKNAITLSIQLKSKLLDTFNCREDIPTSLEMKRDSISEGAVHKWCDKELGIISYSRNSAHTAHNKEVLKTLLNSINKANIRFDDSKINTGDVPEAHAIQEHSTVAELRIENETLRSALAEVYRAYMQIVDNFREDKQVDEAMRKLILNQTNILGKNRLQSVK